MQRRLLILAVVALFATPVFGQGFSYVDQALADVQTDPSVLFGSSLQSDSSFGLFLDSFDYAASNPADLALLTGDESTRHLGRPATREGKAHILYTNLSNFGDVGSLQLAGIFAAGPGNFAAAVGYNKFDSTQTNSFTDFVNPAAWRQVFKDEAQVKQIGLSYGWSIGDAGHLGFSYGYSDLDSPNSFTFQNIAPTPSTFSNGTDFQITDQSFTVAWRGDPSDKLSYNVSVGTLKRDGTDIAREVDNAGVVSFDGIEFGGSFLSVAGRVDLYRDEYDLEFFGSYTTGSFDPDGSVLQNDPADSFDFEYRPLVSGQFDADMTVAGMRYLRRFGDADVAIGLALQNVTYDLDLVYDRADPGPPPGAPTTRMNELLSQDVTATVLPISGRYHISPRLSITAGAQFTLAQGDSDRKDVMMNPPNVTPAFMMESARKVEADFTDTDYRVGLRWEANENITGQLLFGSGTTSLPGGTASSIDTSTAAASVSIHW